MLYELHLTVETPHSPGSRTTTPKWEEFCRAHGAKPLVIDLVPQREPRKFPVGVAVSSVYDADPMSMGTGFGPLMEAPDSQWMFAATHEGDDGSALAWAIEFEFEVAAAGFQLVRKKLEVPLDKSDEYARPKYHECHVKAFIGGDSRLQIIEACQALGWYASRNRLYQRHQGREKWYFTQRQYDAPNNLVAGAAFREAFSKLPASLEWLVRMECETVLTDSNEALDENWIKGYAENIGTADVSLAL